VFAASAAQVSARTWYVKSNGSGDVATLQAAIDSARAGDVVLVAAGKYTWTAQGSGDDYAMLRFLRGKTNFAFRSESGPDVTVLDAEWKGRIFYIQGGDNDQVTIEGFTITRGNAPLFGDFCGGAFLAHLSSPIVRNCVFRDNTADRGAGVYYAGVSGPRFESCTFALNRAGTYGGAVFLVNSSLTPVFANCTMRDNSAGVEGGAIFSYHFPMSLVGCAIYDNTAGQEGGAIYSEKGYPSTITGCTIADNVAPDGSALYLFVCEPLTVASTIIARNHGGVPLTLDRSTLAIGCSDLFGDGAAIGLPPGAVMLVNMLFVDPLFCGLPESVKYCLRSDSPCLQENQGDDMFCGQMGAFPSACAAVGVRSQTWGSIKGIYSR
jgi:hypothetical protein